MNRNDEAYKIGLALHGHKCPAMPLGLRAGLAAMEALGVQHAPDGQLTALVEIDRNHCSTCFADGVQVVTGCTFGKGNIRSLGYICARGVDRIAARLAIAIGGLRERTTDNLRSSVVVQVLSR